MDHKRFSFKAHLEMAHEAWNALLTKEDLAIDATCGNGWDTLFLANRASKVYAFDVQGEAIAKTRQRAQDLDNIVYFQRCHSSFPPEIAAESIKLIVYNLGYLPGGDKSLTTKTESTLQSLNQALVLLQPGGMISVTCYPGHPEGEIEEEKILAWAAALDPALWRFSHQRFNRAKAPSWLSISRIEGGSQPYMSK